MQKFEKDMPEIKSDFLLTPAWLLDQLAALEQFGGWNRSAAKVFLKDLVLHSIARGYASNPTECAKLITGTPRDFSWGW